MEFCLEEQHLSDEMSAASASAYSWSASEEMITVGNAEDIYNENIDLKTAILDESENEGIGDNDLLTALLDDGEELVTAVSHAYSAYSLPASETFVDMDDVEPNCGKTAEMEVSSEMEQDVVGGASPMSTAVTGSISWYSMPPSETNVEMPSSMCEDKTRSVGDRIKDKGDESALKCRDYLENLVLNESATSSALNEAFLEIEETNNNKTAEGRDPYDFDTAIEA
uniref:OTULIN n=1 Tax=Haemonchus contortus TaxID=6289 RepID=A0A7I4XSK3_HAECO